MKKIVLRSFLMLLIFSSCEKKEETLTKSQISARVDSAAAEKINIINEQEKENLKLLEAIEVKPKADSIIQTLTKKNTDTAKHKNAAPKNTDTIRKSTIRNIFNGGLAK